MIDPPPTILAVDDNDMNLRLLSGLLGNQGFEVVLASSGAEALEQISRSAPDVVLLDVIMPDIDGFELCRRIRADPGDALVAGRHDHGLRRAGAAQRARGGRRRLHLSSNQACRAARARALAGAREAVSGSDPASGSRATGADRDPPAARCRTGGADRPAGPTTPLPGATGRGPRPGISRSTRRCSKAIGAKSPRCAVASSTSATSPTAGSPKLCSPCSRRRSRCSAASCTEFDGTVGDFTESGLLVVFNDPLPMPTPALQATRAAITMRERMRPLVVRWQRRGLPLNFRGGYRLRVRHPRPYRVCWS